MRLFGLCSRWCAWVYSRSTCGQYNTADRVGQHFHADIVRYIFLHSYGEREELELTLPFIKRRVLYWYQGMLIRGSACSIFAKVLITHCRSYGIVWTRLYIYIQRTFYDGSSNIKVTESNLSAMGVRLRQDPALDEEKNHSEAIINLLTMMVNKWTTLQLQQLLQLIINST